MAEKIENTDGTVDFIFTNEEVVRALAEKMEAAFPMLLGDAYDVRLACDMEGEKVTRFMLRVDPR